MKLAAPTKKNYVFMGWYRDSKLTKKGARIAKGTTGNITLYAKWQLEKLNINKVGNEDMIWSWGCYGFICKH